MRRPILAGNWKMNMTIAEATDFVRSIRRGLGAIKSVDRVLCPPFTGLAALKDLLSATDIGLGRMAEISNLTFQELSTTAANYIRLETLKEANNRCSAVEGDHRLTFRVIESGGGRSRLSMLVGGDDDPDANQELADTLIQAICGRLPTACELGVDGS